MPKSEEEAFKWFLLAAEQGLALAKRAIAIMYGEGVGVERNKEEAEKWLERAGQVNVKP